MTHFVAIAKETTKDGNQRLVAIFKGVVIHIAVHNEQELLKGASRYRKAALNQYGHVPKAEAHKAANAFVGAALAIKKGTKNFDDFPEVATFAHAWRFELT